MVSSGTGGYPFPTPLPTGPPVGPVPSIYQFGRAPVYARPTRARGPPPHPPPHPPPRPPQDHTGGQQQPQGAIPRRTRSHQVPPVTQRGPGVGAGGQPPPDPNGRNTSSFFEDRTPGGIEKSINRFCDTMISGNQQTHRYMFNA